MSFANTIQKTDASDNAWEQSVFDGFISKADHELLYSIAGGNTYSGGSTYENTAIDASGYGGLIYGSSTDDASAVTITIAQALDGSDTIFSGWKLRGQSDDGHLARGGVFYAGDLTITGTATFQDNYVFGYHTESHFTYGGEGGVIYANDLNLAGGSEFINNFADTRGGAIAASGTVIIGENTLFKGNVSSSGGAISNIVDTSTLTIGANSTFDGNRAYYGGAISAPTTDSLVTINDGTIFTNNMAEYYGGALYVANVNFNYTGLTADGSKDAVISSGNTVATLPKDTTFEDHIAFAADGESLDLNNGGEGGFLYLRPDGTATFNVST